DGQVVADGEGTVYITTGAGGGRLDEPPTPAPPFMAAANGSTYSFTVVDVQSAEFAVRQIATDGSVLDAATVVTPARVPASAADGLHPNVAERMTAKAPGTPRRIRTANRHE
ncbi:MAG: hypothetical protein JXA69_08110, partial [Phycisphaerae bacterium]|nr:hypothetical protein [Phycisphaerae bacterium]